MNAKELSVSCNGGGGSTIKVWAECSSPEDIDELIGWLKLAQRLAKEWAKRRHPARLRLREVK